MPALSFTIIFSAVSASSGARATSKSESVRLPVSITSLWQTTQYCLTTAVRESVVRLRARARRGVRESVRDPGSRGRGPLTDGSATVARYRSTAAAGAIARAVGSRVCEATSWADAAPGATTMAKRTRASPAARRPEPVDGSFREPCATETGAGRTGTRRCAFRLRAQGLQHDTQLWLLTAPRPSRSSIVAGNGWMRWTGPFAMSTVVCPRRLTAMTSAPLIDKVPDQLVIASGRGVMHGVVAVVVPGVHVGAQLLDQVPYGGEPPVGHVAMRIARKPFPVSDTRGGVDRPHCGAVHRHGREPRPIFPIVVAAAAAVRAAFGSARPGSAPEATSSFIASTSVAYAARQNGVAPRTFTRRRSKVVGHVPDVLPEPDVGIGTGIEQGPHHVEVAGLLLLVGLLLRIAGLRGPSAC